jgi:hypothetical protein
MTAATVNNHIASMNASSGSTLESGSFAVGGSNRVLYVMVGSAGGTPIACTSVKWGGSGGVEMTQIGTTQSVGSYGRNTLWQLIAPTAQTSTIYATYGAPTAIDERWLFAVAVEDADQGTPNNTVAQTVVNNANPTLNCTSVSGDLVLDFLLLIEETGTGYATLACDASQTLIDKYDGNAINVYDYGGVSKETASGTTTTMSWTFTLVSASEFHGHFALAVNGAAVGGGSITLMGQAVM